MARLARHRLASDLPPPSPPPATPAPAVPRTPFDLTPPANHSRDYARRVPPLPFHPLRRGSTPRSLPLNLLPSLSASTLTTPDLSPSPSRREPLSLSVPMLTTLNLFPSLSILLDLPPPRNHLPSLSQPPSSSIPPILSLALFRAPSRRFPPSISLSLATLGVALFLYLSLPLSRNQPPLSGRRSPSLVSPPTERATTEPARYSGVGRD